MKNFAAVVVAILLAASLNAASIEGMWAATVKGDRVDIDLNFDQETERHGSSHVGDHERLADLRGLSAANVSAAAQTPVQFDLQREAGTIRFEGIFRNGKGAGQFEFTPDAAFASKLAAAGVRMPSRGIEPGEQMIFVLNDFTSAEVKEIASLGFKNLSLDDVVAAALFDLSPAMVREFRAAGYDDVDFDTLTALKIHGVTVAGIRELESLGLGKLSLEDAIAMRIHGVTPEFVREVRKLGYPNASGEELVEMRIFNVTPQLIRDLAAAGYKDLTIERLVEIKMHDADEILLKKKK